jgi:hypothetical protein
MGFRQDRPIGLAINPQTSAQDTDLIARETRNGLKQPLVPGMPGMGHRRGPQRHEHAAFQARGKRNGMIEAVRN